MFAFAHEIKSGRIIENETTARVERTEVRESKRDGVGCKYLRFYRAWHKYYETPDLKLLKFH